MTGEEIILMIVIALALAGIIALQYVGKKMVEHTIERGTCVDPGMPGDPQTPLGYEGTKALYTLDDPETAAELERLLSKDQYMVLENGRWVYRRLGGNDSIRGIIGDPNPDNPIGISKCPYCNRKVDTKKDNCPGCGAPY